MSGTEIQVTRPEAEDVIAVPWQRSETSKLPSILSRPIQETS